MTAVGYIYIHSTKCAETATPHNRKDALKGPSRILKEEQKRKFHLLYLSYINRTDEEEEKIRCRFHFVLTFEEDEIRC